MREVVLIVHNIRSTYNVGSLFRTADGLGVKKIYLTGYTPFPFSKKDPRLPHLARRLDRQIDKVALGAQNSVSWEYHQTIRPVINSLKTASFEIVALEQAPNSISLKSYSPPTKLALIVGEEVNGIDASIIKLCDKVIEIPMMGMKESFNVSVAAAIGLSQLTL